MINSEGNSEGSKKKNKRRETEGKNQISIINTKRSGVEVENQIQEKN